MEKEKLRLALFCLFLPLFLLLFSYKTALFFTSLSPPQKETIDYLSQAGNQRPLSLNYTPAEWSHLDDVKKVMQRADELFYGLLLILTLIITSGRKDKEHLRKLFLCGGGVSALVAGLILLSAWLNFDSLFTLFHRIFFSQGNWLFAPGSLLIQVFPLGFFVKISTSMLLGTWLWGILLLGAGLFLEAKDL